MHLVIYILPEKETDLLTELHCNVAKRIKSRLLQYSHVTRWPATHNAEVKV